MEDEFNLLKTFIKLKVQTSALGHSDYFTWDYFLKNLKDERYDLSIPRYFDMKLIFNGKLIDRTIQISAGLPVDCIAFRRFNYYGGIKIFTDSPNGEWQINSSCEISNILKSQDLFMNKEVKIIKDRYRVNTAILNFLRGK